MGSDPQSHLEAMNFMEVDGQKIFPEMWRNAKEQITDLRRLSSTQAILTRQFWEAVFLQQLGEYVRLGWKDSSPACAAKDADDSLKEWNKRWGNL